MPLKQRKKPAPATDAAANAAAAAAAAAPATVIAPIKQPAVEQSAGAPLVSSESVSVSTPRDGDASSAAAAAADAPASCGWRVMVFIFGAITIGMAIHIGQSGVFLANDRSAAAGGDSSPAPGSVLAGTDPSGGVFWGQHTYRWSRRTIVDVLHIYARALHKPEQSAAASGVATADDWDSAYRFWLRVSEFFITHHARAASGYWFADTVRLLMTTQKLAAGTLRQPPPPEFDRGAFSNKKRAASDGDALPAPPIPSDDPFVKWYYDISLPFYTNLVDHMLPALSKHFAAAIDRRHTAAARADNLHQMSEYFERAERECTNYFEDEFIRLNETTRRWFPLATQQTIFNRMSQSVKTGDLGLIVGIQHDPVFGTSDEYAMLSAEFPLGPVLTAALEFGYSYYWKPKYDAISHHFHALASQTAARDSAAVTVVATTAAATIEPFRLRAGLRLASTATSSNHS